MRHFWCTFAAALIGVLPAHDTDVLFSRPHTGGGNLLMSAYWDPDGSDLDEYAWDDFTLPAAGDISELRWRGGGGATVNSFVISIYASIPAGTQPDIGNMNGGKLASYTIANNAGETYAGTFAGTALYDYHCTLKKPFHAIAGTKYWIQIEAWTASWPSWGLATGSGGPGYHFHRSIAVTGDYRFYYAPGNAAFTLLGTSTACSNPTISQGPRPVTICNNAGSAVFSVAASGAGTLSYCWRQNGSPVYDGPNGGGHGGGASISGATTSTLTIDYPSSWADIGTYDCVVTNACGPTTSAGALLSFATPPGIATGPDPVATCPDSTATFTISAPTATGFAWSKDGVPLTDGPTAAGSVVIGAGTASLQIQSAQPADSGVYACDVSNDCGTNSAAASLVVCAPDFNCDGFVDIYDFSDFVTCFEGGTCPSGATADFNRDGFADIYDFTDFVNAFESGC